MWMYTVNVISWWQILGKRLFFGAQKLLSPNRIINFTEPHRWIYLRSADCDALIESDYFILQIFKFYHFSHCHFFANVKLFSFFKEHWFSSSSFPMIIRLPPIIGFSIDTWTRKWFLIFCNLYYQGSIHNLKYLKLLMMNGSFQFSVFYIFFSKRFVHTSPMNVVSEIFCTLGDKHKYDVHSYVQWSYHRLYETLVFFLLSYGFNSMQRSQFDRLNMGRNNSTHTHIASLYLDVVVISLWPVD